MIEPTSTAPFVCTQADTIRLTGSGIAGSSIVVSIVGPAKLVAQHNVGATKDGQPVKGLDVQQFDLMPTGLGNVEATVSVMPPQAGSPVTETRYSFEVK